LDDLSETALVENFEVNGIRGKWQLMPREEWVIKVERAYFPEQSRKPITVEGRSFKMTVQKTWGGCWGLGYGSEGSGRLDKAELGEANITALVQLYPDLKLFAEDLLAMGR
jgi:hypothetical protein